MEFTNNFEENIKLFTNVFERDQTFRIKYITNSHDPTLKIAVLLINCMVSSEIVDRDVIRPLSSNKLSQSIDKAEMRGINAHSTKILTSVKDVITSISSGDCAVIIGDNAAAVVIDSKGYAQRSIDAPETEISVAGPAEGFNENIMTNLALVKRRVMSPKLKTEFMTAGEQSNSIFAVCYIDGIAKPEIVERVKQRLENINIDYLGDTNYIAELIRDNKISFVKTYGKTNRPDVFTSKLLEGRIGIILNGSPTALTLPYLFIENFQTPDDYYLNCWYANVGRALRLIGFLLSFLLPSLYISILLHHESMLPPEWLYSISASQNGVPIPSLLEMIILFAVFEILRETGARMPSSIGLALNIVGAIILGQAAVDAKLVSAPMVIVVAFSGVTGLMVYDLKGVVFYVRAALIIVGSLLGLPGVIMGVVLFALLLFNMSSLGIPIMYAGTPLCVDGQNDTFFRVPIDKMNTRQRLLANNIKRQGRI